MTEDELKEHTQDFEVFPQEELEETFYYDEEDDYQDYYESYYGSLDEEEVEQEKRIANSWVTRTRTYYQSQFDQLKEDYQDRVSLQKSYYEDKDNHWLQKQQSIRNDAFLRKLAVTLFALVVISFVLFLLSRL
jgi:hypothetical protein